MGGFYFPVLVMSGSPRPRTWDMWLGGMSLFWAEDEGSSPVSAFSFSLETSNNPGGVGVRGQPFSLGPGRLMTWHSASADPTRAHNKSKTPLLETAEIFLRRYCSRIQPGAEWYTDHSFTVVTTFSQSDPWLRHVDKDSAMPSQLPRLPLSTWNGGSPEHQ